MTHRNLSDLRSKNAEMEEQMIQLNKELHANQEIAKALEIDLKENVAQKNDQVNNTTVPSIKWMVWCILGQAKIFGATCLTQDSIRMVRSTSGSNFRKLA